MIRSVREQSEDLMPDTVALRRTLHEWPELGNELPITRDHVLASLEGLPLDVTTHESTSGIVATLEGARPGPTLLLRGDMDALPMSEDTGLEFTSNVDGCMHACGHDTHTAMLSSAAKLLSTRRDDIAGRVLFMFQPGEEGHHGARFMLNEGLLDVPDRSDGTPSPVDAAFALHITSALPTGWVSTRGGPIMASADTMSIRIVGRGGHASEPHRALDPIPVACEIVQALQTMITRSIDPFDPSVVTVGRITAGTTNNVIPEVAEIETAYYMLTPLLGAAAAGVFLVSLIASGVSSSVVGTMAGQIIMQGFVGFRIPIWLRRLVTMAPAFVVVAMGVNATQALVVSQVILSLALPIPMIALVHFTARRDIMGDFANGRLTTAAAIIGAAVVLGLNMVLLLEISGIGVPGLSG